MARRVNAVQSQIPKHPSGSFESRMSWNVLYWDSIHDDARRMNGLWYYRDLTNGAYRPFACQSEVRPRFTNDFTRAGSKSSRPNKIFGKRIAHARSLPDAAR